MTGIMTKLMKRTLYVLSFIGLFSWPLIGIPLGIVVGTHAAYYCEAEQAILQCITEEVETWKEKLY